MPNREDNPIYNASNYDGTSVGVSLNFATPARLADCL